MASNGPSLELLSPIFLFDFMSFKSSYWLPVAEDERLELSPEWQAHERTSGER